MLLQVSVSLSIGRVPQSLVPGPFQGYPRLACSWENGVPWAGWGIPPRPRQGYPSARIQCPPPCQDMGSPKDKLCHRQYTSCNFPQELFCKKVTVWILKKNLLLFDLCCAKKSWAQWIIYLILFVKWKCPGFGVIQLQTNNTCFSKKYHLYLILTGDLHTD